jgi:uncharacterized membrane protein YbhN (UPF0104 family)
MPLFRAFSSPWVKVLVAVSVLALLVYFNRVDATVLVDLVHTWPWLLAAFMLMLPPFLIVSYRFKVVLHSQGFHVPVMQAIRWTMIGSFFDLAMPSSSGGDLVKAGYVVRHAGAGQSTRAVMAVVFDRVFGLLGLFLLVTMASGFGWEMLRKMPARHVVVWFAVVVSLGTLAALRLLGSRGLYRNSKINGILSRYAWGLPIKQFIASFNSLRERPHYLFMVLGLSVLNHVFWCASLLCIVRVVGVSVDAIEGFVVFPLAIFSNIFGVAGGFGGGTLGFDMILSQLLAVGNGALIGLLFQTLSALARLGGLPFYLLSTSGRVRTENPEFPGK